LFHMVFVVTLCKYCGFGLVIPHVLVGGSLCTN
jgi:coproporphyrinogen III oxidase-like Fe-S oxidoreductase